MTIAWLGFFLEFSLKIQKGVLYLVSIVTNIATVTIGGTLATSSEILCKMKQQQILHISILSTVLIVVLAVIILYSVPKLAFCQECAVYMEAHEKSGEFTATIDEILKRKKLYNYEFIGNDKLDKETFEKYKNDIHLMMKSNDTTKLIRFKFNKATNYQEFINVFDVCFVEGANYSYNENDLWITNDSKKSGRTVK